MAVSCANKNMYLKRMTRISHEDEMYNFLLGNPFPVCIRNLSLHFLRRCSFTIKMTDSQYVHALWKSVQLLIKTYFHAVFRCFSAICLLLQLGQHYFVKYHSSLLLAWSFQLRCALAYVCWRHLANCFDVSRRYNGYWLTYRV